MVMYLSSRVLQIYSLAILETVELQTRDNGKCPFITLRGCMQNYSWKTRMEETIWVTQ
jgi:hypothetical protein